MGYFFSNAFWLSSKKRKEIYPLFRTPNYEKILVGSKITEKEFKKWHRENTEKIHRNNVMLSIGWSAKLINVFLKTKVYIAGEGRFNLVKCIHPPIDNILWKGIKHKYPSIIGKNHIFITIQAIDTYEKYETIINLCREIAKDRKCLLIEVDELWDPK